MAKNKVTATGGAQGKRAALGTYPVSGGGVWVLFSDGWTRRALREELSGLPQLAPAFALAYVEAAKKAAQYERETEAELARKARVKHFRVRWTEEYEKVFEAESEDEAIENRDDDGAFVGCMESSAQEVERCYKAAPEGRKECAGCDACENGWRPVVKKEVD